MPTQTRYITPPSIFDIRTPADLIERLLMLEPAQPPPLLQLFAKMLAGEFTADPDILMMHASEIQALIDEVYETAHQTQEMIQQCLQLQPGSSTRV